MLDAVVLWCSYFRIRITPLFGMPARRDLIHNVERWLKRVESPAPGHIAAKPDLVALGCSKSAPRKLFAMAGSHNQ